MSDKLNQAGIKHDPRNVRKHTPLSTAGYSALPTAGGCGVGFVSAADGTNETSRCGSMIGVFAGSAERRVSRFLPAALRTPVVRATRALALGATLRWSPQVPNLTLDSRMARDAKHLQIIRFIRCADAKRDAMVNMKVASMDFMVTVVRQAAFFAHRATSIDGLDTNSRPFVAVPIIEAAAPVGMTVTGDLRSMLRTSAVIRTVIRRFPYVTRDLLKHHAATIARERHALAVGHSSAFMRAKPLTALIAIHSGCWQGERLAARFTYPRDRIRFQPAIPSVFPSITGVF